MDFSRFIEVAPGNALISYRRALSNWVVERQKLIDSQIAFKLHRISAKRYVFEIEGGERPKLPQAMVAGIALSLAILLTIGGAMSVLLSKFQFDSSSQSLHTIQSSISPSPFQCSELSLVDLRAATIDDFEIGGWRVQTKPLQVQLGEFLGFEFEANCATDRRTGRLIAVQNAHSWQIKRMVLVD